jgi:hypothetical protein
MANIQIVGEILNSSTISRYSDQDTRLISSQEIQDDFGAENDYIEYYIYDIGGNLLNSTYTYSDFKLPSDSNLAPLPNNSTSNTTNSIPSTDVGIVSNTNTQSGSLYPIIEIDPVQDLQNNSYTSGEFTVRYNFFRNKISSPSADLFIKEISSDRTEIGVVSTILTNEEIEQGFNTLVSEISGSIYFVDYLLNFGNNQQALTVNVALNKLDSGYEIYFKLYEPLPDNIVEKNTLWVVDEKVDPYTFDINLDTLILTPPGLQLRGPNFNVPVKLQEGTISTSYQNYDNLLNNLQSLQSSSYSKILNLLTTQSIDINVDYTNFSEFSFFGSSKQRLENFYTKVKEIEDYNNLINTYVPNVVTTSSLQLEISSSRNSINDIISKFDGFEYYLYFESSSYTWPKTNSVLPYTLRSTGSAIALNWYNAYTSSAEFYDNNNVNLLKNTLPTFILDDCANDQYIVFINMMGQYFDNIWIFLKAITDVNLANNNLEQGVSKDLVYHVLKSYGIKLYNSQGGEDLDQFLIGANSGSAIFDDNFSPTGSYLNNIPRKDLLSEIYKRIYHNLPYLVKNKGTVAGVEGLITTFGITGSILNTKEFGGGTKSSLLKGYNNEKVRIVDNTITGSVLSAFIPLQQSPTASNEFRDDDLNYLDVSFSPQTQIDTYISGAIASNNPTFILDDYIGDPRQQYDNVYPDLETQQKLYFETGVPGYSGFTGSFMDYNGFIRLIQFFDNALFKMITDFVPARTSLSTGVTINSPVLERNKVSYAEPLVNNQFVYDADYNDNTRISPQYGQLYDNLTGSKAAFFTGELSGSGIDIYNNYFEPANSNYYLHPTSSLTTNDLDIFNHSDFNVMLNNVTSSRLSLTRQGIEYIIGNTGSLLNRTILTPVQLQDSYQSLTSYNTSRYSGSKVTSATYNTYTIGDESFGKTAAIDHQVRKIALFSEIKSSSLFSNYNNVAIKYLVDEFGGLTELNQRNKNWEEVQNTFKQSSTLAISQFDNQKFSNQKNTDGVKLIYNSGYSYSPVLYLSRDTVTLNFRTEGFKPDISVIALNSGSNNIVGYIPNGFPLSSTYKIISNFGNLDDEPIGLSNFYTGSSGTDNVNLLPTYSSSLSTQYAIQVTASIQVTESITQQGYVTYELGAYKHNASNPLNLANSGSYLVSSVSASYVNLLAQTYTNSDYVGINITGSFVNSTTSQTQWDTLTNLRNITYFRTVKTVDELISNNYYDIAFDIFIDEPLKGGEIVRFGNLQNRYYDLIVDEYIVGEGNVNDQLINLSNRMVELITAVSPFQNFVPGGQPTVRTGASISNLGPNAFTLRFQTFRSSISNNRISINMYEKYWRVLNEGTFTPNEDITENNTVIIPSGTTLYKYTLKDFNLSTGVGTTRTLWSKESEIKLRFLTRPNSVVNQRYIPTSIPAGGGSFDYYTLFSSLYMPTNKINGLYIIPDTSLVTLDDSGKTLNLNLSLNNYFLAEGDKLTFILKQKAIYPSWDGFYKAQFNSNIQNKIKVSGDSNIRAITNDNIALLNPILSLRQDPSNNNFTTLYLDSDLSSVYTPLTSSGDQIFYAPNIEGDISDIYSKYGDVDYAFHMNIGDSIILKDARNFTYEFGVKEVVYDSVNKCYGFKLLSTMDSTLFNELFFNTDNKRYFEILYLNKIKDETNVLAVFTKKDGRTSYGFIIPDNLHPDVLANIDTITKEVKQKLLADQQGTVTG